jgi:Esterase-like activity of phytase
MRRHNAKPCGIATGRTKRRFLSCLLRMGVAGSALLFASLLQAQTPPPASADVQPNVETSILAPPPPSPEQPLIPFAANMLAPEVQAQTSASKSVSAIQIANLPLGLVIFPNGKAMNLTVGIGSSAFRQQGDSQGRVWLLTDRGPNIECLGAKKLIGLDHDALCAGDKNGRIYPLAGFAPSIYGVEIGADQNARINVFIPLKGRSGKPVSGRSPKGEQAFGIDGKALPPDPSGIDPEAFVRLTDGTFWIAEEFGPSLLHVSADGTILKRLVPNGTAGDFKDADYEIVPSLPTLMRKRVPNRGFEALALSPDERFLYVMMQGALAHPNAETAQTSRHMRIWKIERETGAVFAQYLYALDDAASFKAESDGKERMQSQVNISDMTAIGEDRLLVLERIDRVSRIFRIHLRDENLIPTVFDDEAVVPSLEASTWADLASRGLVPTHKKLVLDSEDTGGLHGKIEGMAVLSPAELVLINDNDFGIDGVRTQMFRVTLPVPLIP